MTSLFQFFILIYLSGPEMDSFGTEVQNISELAYMTWMLCNQKIKCFMFTIFFGRGSIHTKARACSRTLEARAAQLFWQKSEHKNLNISIGWCESKQSGLQGEVSLWEHLLINS